MSENPPSPSKNTHKQTARAPGVKENTNSQILMRGVCWVGDREREQLSSPLIPFLTAALTVKQRERMSFLVGCVEEAGPEKIKFTLALLVSRA